MITIFNVIVLLVPLHVASTALRPIGPLVIQTNGLDSSITLAALEKKLNPDGIQGECKTNDSSPIDLISGNPRESSRWDKSVGYLVQLDPNSPWTQDEMKLIEGSLYELSTVLCIPIKIWPRASRPTGDYVLIMKGGPGTGCYASGIGRQGGRQVINLQVPGCLVKGIIMHENIHALGFHHEQTRPDRDNYINVHFNEIYDGNAQNQYRKYEGSLSFGVPYDYSSIMHYGSYDFSKRGNPTMTRKSDNSIIVKQRNGLTSNDKAKLRAMYKC